MRSRILTNLSTAIVLGAALGFPAPSLAEDEPTVALRWALGAQPTKDAEASAVVRDAALATGTRLKFLVEPLSDGAFYLILLDSSNEIVVLYRKLAGPQGEDPTYVPPGSRWFELDEKSGRETFFLLASVEPLPELDALLDEHASATTTDDSSALGERIVREIRRLHRAHRDFARPVEKPVMIGGQIRGEETAAQVIDNLAVEILAERFYGKTITIDH